MTVARRTTVFRLPLTVLTVGCVVGAALAARGRLDAAAAQLADANGLSLLVAAICAPLVPAATAGAWRSVLASRGIALTVAEAWGCYGLGSVANTFLPGRAGDALRVELFSRRLQRRNGRWLACGVSASVGVAQSMVFGCVLGIGSLLGAFPLGPALALPAVTWVAGRILLRRPPGERVACLATAATLSPLAWARVFAWVATAAAGRVLLVAAVLQALGAPHGPATAIVALGGAAVGAALPLAPGGAGVAAATMSVALTQAGLTASTAVATAVSFHAFETAAGLLFGAGGWAVLRLVERTRVAVAPELVAAS